MIVVVAEMGERSSLGDAPRAACLLTVYHIVVVWNNLEQRACWLLGHRASWDLTLFLLLVLLCESAL